MFDDKPFCCTGCRTVYQLLSDNDACDYYQIDNAPGLKNISAEIGNKFAYLDNEKIKSELLEFSDGGISKVRFFIPSIHCSSCIWLLENLNRFNEGIVQATVNFVKKEINITYREEKISLRQLVELMSSINYAPQISLDDLEKKSKKTTNRSIYYKLGVAGFSFGNIMLLSFPEYLNYDNALESSYRSVFAWINLVLAIPVVFYAATDYFISAIKGLRKGIVNIDCPISLGIFVLFARSAWEIIGGSGAGYLDSMSGLVFFLLIGKWYQGITYQALSFERNYKSYFPVAVTVIDADEEETSIPLKDLKIGDRIVVRNQELIPADAILLKGQASIDYSFVSGESTPVPKLPKDLIYAGGKQIGSSIELIVEKEVTQSYLTELWNQDIGKEENESGLDSIVNNVSRYFTIVILLIALFAGTYWLIVDPDIAMNAFTSVLIVACPCALALTIPFAFGSAMRVFGRSGFYLKKNEIIERLTKVNTIVFDKTGTITQNDEFEVDTGSIALSAEESLQLKSLVKHSTHPMSVAIYRSIDGNGLPENRSFHEIPAEGIEGVVADNRIKLGSETFVKGTKIQKDVYTSRVYVSINEDYKGYFQIRNKYRPGLTDVIKKLNNKYELHLLSGDNDSEMDKLLPLFGNKGYLHFNQSPTNKLNYIKKLRDEGKTILMIGDGLNDAGALMESDVGISIADNIYHFSPACDAILEAGKFNSLPKYLSFPTTSMRIIKISFAISFLYNIFGIYFAVQGYLTPILSAILMPISSVTVVAFVTLSSNWIAKRKKI
ncbi:MAG: heavy metal translocating P-type ATPase [Bacteroidetes bacterium]|nr:MAG: heavy metal translocating P-type ATPase [Bacteroidota bacterium]